MQKKTIILAVASFAIGALLYWAFSFLSVSHNDIDGDNSNATTTAPTSTIATTTASSSAQNEAKTASYSAAINAKRGVIIYLGGLAIGSVSHSVIGIPGASFVVVQKIEKTGNRFFAVVQYSDGSVDFGIISGKKLSYSPLTKNSGVTNVGTGIVFSPEKSYAAFQYARNGGECKKDLMLGVVDLVTGKLSYPDVKRSYEIDTGKWQVEMGGYRFENDSTLLFVDMPRACNGIGNYDAQKYYSWNIKTGELGILSF